MGVVFVVGCVYFCSRSVLDVVLMLEKLRVSGCVVLCSVCLCIYVVLSLCYIVLNLV